MLRKSVRKTAALSWLKRLLSGGQQLSLPPSVLQQLTDAEYVQVQKVSVKLVLVGYTSPAVRCSAESTDSRYGADMHPVS